MAIPRVVVATPVMEGQQVTAAAEAMGKKKNQTQGGVCTRLMTVKSINELQAEVGEQELHRSLGAFELTMLGIGDIVGTGIFVLTGTAAANNAGPAVMLSFVIAVSWLQ